MRCVWSSSVSPQFPAATNNDEFLGCLTSATADFIFFSCYKYENLPKELERKLIISCHPLDVNVIILALDHCLILFCFAH